MLGLGFALFVSLGGVSAMAPPEPVRLTEPLIIGWDANPPEELVTGYQVAYGPTCDGQMQAVEVGLVTAYQYTADQAGLTSPVCFAVRARNAGGVSDPSFVVFTPATTTEPPPPPPPPTTDPRCVSPLGDRVVSIFITRWEPTTGSPGSMARINFQLASPNSPIVDLKVLLNGTATIDQPGTDLRASGGIWFQTPVTPGTYTIAVQATNAYGCTAVQGKNALGQALTVVVQ